MYTEVGITQYMIRYVACARHATDVLAIASLVNGYDENYKCMKKKSLKQKTNEHKKFEKKQRVREGLFHTYLLTYLANLLKELFTVS